jgi:hypothetical protein
MNSTKVIESNFLRLLWFQLFVVFLSCIRANATLEGPCTFHQPILTYDAGVIDCPVTYTCQFDPWACPGYRVTWTFAKNSTGTQYGFENRNAASLAGLRCEMVQRPKKGQNEFHGLFGDTLKVNLVVPPTDSLFAGSERFDAQYSGILPDILSVTVQCMKLNASDEYPRYKFLSIEIRGAPDDSAFSGVFPVEVPPGK